ncbi:antiporter [Aromatoleum aromaticum]|uniref:Nitrate/nitrite antiporter n=1 Tax=Aromatoleum aromaticum (strain DSM 19018 / LMG 30748 / EbN1) TaxID=76114 RepID=Q5NYZ3_AROAE|nr:antiporter [Aromatoleum aromaticum]NMG55645.1 antiporter [Aromatoleum aromaticum]CAI09721.1 Nitrate/nitrite antiporter [Aromatoleum aromaticum EbN1]
MSPAKLRPITATPGAAGVSPGERPRGPDIAEWHPEDAQFWAREGSRIANRNLWISIPSLLCGFAVWLMWGIITVQMANAGFPFTPDQLFSIAAISGLSGATLRIPASFFIRLCGGRNTVWLTTVLLIIPALGTGIALQDKNTPLWVFQLMALLSGIGGGNFACSMANISTFFPKRLQGTALGLNAGLGNFGVTTSQILIPAVMTLGLFGAIGGDAIPLAKDSATLIGKIAAGTPTFVQNAGFVWLLLLVPLAVIGWFGLNNLKVVSPNTGSTGVAMGRILLMYGIALAVSGIGLYLYLPTPNGSGLLAGNGMWIVLPLVIFGTLFALKAVATGEMKTNLNKQFAIFGNKHTWSMTALYVVTFGSFIGFSMALPLSITVIFGNTHVFDPAANVWVHAKNPNAPSALMYAWIGPFVGALIRPVGGWISDKLGGSIVTQVISVVLVGASAVTGYVMHLAYQSATPESYFLAFMLLFILLFAASGIGNGSTFRTVGFVFDQDQRGPVLGWTSAVAAYGSFIAPVVIGGQIKAGTPENAMYGFAVFYAACLVLNWWFYLRKNAYIRNP